jgi:hypothetical protein
LLLQKVSHPLLLLIKNHPGFAALIERDDNLSGSLPQALCFAHPPEGDVPKRKCGDQGQMNEIFTQLK